MPQLLNRVKPRHETTPAEGTILICPLMALPLPLNFLKFYFYFNGKKEKKSCGLTGSSFQSISGRAGARW